MFSKILNWCFGYTELEEKQHPVEIPDEATHILVIRSEDEIQARKYNSLYKFRKIYFDELILAYDNNRDIVFDTICTGFGNISLYEFVHLVLPNQQVEIEHIPVDYYLSGIKTPVTTEYLQSNDNYICRCKNSASSCVFHKFLIEKLYNKYKKDVYAKNSNFCDDNDDVWSLG